MLLLVKVILTLWVSWAHGQERECMVPDIEQSLLAQPRKDKYVIGDMLTFSCRNRHLTLIGPDSLQCYHFGWSRSPPTCKEEVQSCDQPPRLPNGTVADTPKGEYEHGEVVEYVCNPRFLMKGARKIQCVDGEWTPLPVCVEEDRTCGDIPELDHGEVVSPARPSYHHGESVEFTCGEDFTMIGHSSVTCIRGTWTQPPQCIATVELKTCKLPKTIAYETKLSGRIEYEHNKEISYTCGRKSEQKHSVCVNGKWEPEVTCTEAPRCPPPPQIPNSQHMAISVYFQEGEKISILCQENFLIQEGEEIVCQDGRWQSIPRCVGNTLCSQPPHVEHGSIISSKLSGEGRETLGPKLYAHGTTLSYICKDGFKLSKEDGITCHRGKWSAPPQCVGLPCGPPPEVSNAVLFGRLNSYPHGEKYTYTCDSGFQIRGPPYVECSGGKWSSPPECTTMTCPSPPSYDNAILVGQLKNSYKSGEQVAYRCAEHYQMDGSNIVQCMNGRWIGTPTCKGLSCGSPPSVQNAFIPNQKSRYQHEDTARYECRHPLGLFGNAVVTCFSGKWTVPPECKEPTGQCGSPPAIDNGDITTDPLAVYAPGSSVEYQCQAYHELEGNRRITCLDGQWSEPPKCLGLPCGSPPSVKNAFIPNQKPNYRHGDTARYECRNSRELFGNAEVTCLPGKWTDPPECKEPTGQCGRPPAIDNGDITTDPLAVYAPGSSVEYQCQAFYELEGNRRITCRDGQWSEPPKCLGLPCSSPPTVQNAFIPNQKPNYGHGDTARYECRNSLGLVGNAEVTCLRGKWTDPPECKESTGQCGRPPAIDNGDITTDPLAVYAPGSSVEYQCQAYHELEGNRRITCRDGQWSEPPKCLGLPCSSPPTVQNAFIPNQKPNYGHGDTARYECRNSLVLVGNAEVTCLRGKWTDPPECKEPTGQCKPPPAIDNGDITTDPLAVYAPGSSVEYQCQAFYELEGNRRITCRDGQWSEPPKCLGLPCSSPPTVQNAFIPNQKPNYGHGDTARYECRNSLGLVGKAEVTCLRGKWTDPPECKESTGQCKPPPAIDNGDITTDPLAVYAPGSSVEYQCQAYHELEGNRRITCRDGQWSEPPKCLGLPCSSPPTVQNAFIPNQKPNYRHGDTARYECRNSLGLVGNAEVTCLRGKWTGPPECKEPTGQCKPPPAIDNGDITTDPLAVYAPGSSVEYQCQAYYELEGNRRITCRDGQWSEPPKCLGLPCGSPPTVQNAFIPNQKPNYGHGDTARYECRNSLGLVGNAEVTCLRGKWTDPPECKAMTCPSPPSYGNAILVGRKKKNSYKSGEQVTYRCPKYYQMDGSSVVQCMNGRWIGTPTCRDLSCGSPPSVQNAFIPNQKPRYRHGDTARYECRHPLGLFGIPVVTCFSGKWSDPPECKEPTGQCKPPPAIDNGDITTYPLAVYAPGSSVEYQCQASYELEGNRRITCRDGQWSEPPKCLAMTCPSPPSYDNAILVGQPKNSYKSGEQVTYRCAEQCKMEGSSVVQCMNGRWIGTLTCKDRSCGSPPTVQNAFIRNRMPRYRPGDTVLYECTNSLGLFGNPVVTCLSGEWTDPPECKESTGQCGPPPAIDNGDVTTYISPFYAPGSSVEYQCQAFYELEGNRRITCHDGQWSEPPKCLDACVISEEIMKKHNIQLKWSYAKKIYSGTNDYVEFMCRPPYRRVSPASAFRAQCREGKLEYPTCA